MKRFALLLAVAVQCAAAARWSPSSLPNPMLSPAACGRPGVARSAVCDPDSLLSKTEKDEIEGAPRADWHSRVCAAPRL